MEHLKKISEGSRQDDYCLICFFISRMQQAANAAARHGRKIVFAGTSTIDNAKIARKMGYLDIPDDMFVRPDKIQTYPMKSLSSCYWNPGRTYLHHGSPFYRHQPHFRLKTHDTVIFRLRLSGQ